MGSVGELREKQWRRRVLLGAVVAVVVVVLGGLSAEGHRDSHVSWPRIALWAVIAVALVGGVFALFAWLRRRNPRTFGRSTLWDLEPADRREVRRAIRQGTDVRPELRDVAYRAAHQMTQLGAFIWIYVVLALLEIVNGLFLQEGFSRWFAVVGGACFLVASFAFRRQVRQAQRAEQRFR